MLLAIDTSTPQMGIALYDEGKVIAEISWTSTVMHTVELAPTVVDLLQRTKVELKQVEAIAIAIGPGSFTSLRVGLSFVKGLAFARNIPVAGINSLDILAAGTNMTSSDPLICTLPAGRGRHAVAWYRYSTRPKWHMTSEPKIFTIEELTKSINKEVLFCGDISDTERAILKKNEQVTLFDPVFCIRRPAVLAMLAQKKIKKGQVDDIQTLAPYYLHIANPLPASQ